MSELMASGILTLEADYRSRSRIGSRCRKPLPGMNEIHVWRDERGNTHVDPGINYWERRGEQKGGVYWDVEARPMTEQERGFYDIPENVYAAICRGVRMSDIREMREMGFNIGDILKARAVTGIGTATKGEYAKKGRPPIWSAIKRAKTDFYKSAFPYIPGEPITPGVGLRQVEDGRIEPDFQDPHWGQMDTAARDYPDPEPMTDDEMEDWNDILFGNGEPVEGEYEEVPQEDDVEPTPFDDMPGAASSVIARLRTRANNPNKQAQASKKARTAVRLGLESIFPADVDRIAFIRTVYGKESTTDLTIAEASAILEWMERDEEYNPSRRAVNEGQAVLKSALKEQGQMGLFDDEEE